MAGHLVVLKWRLLRNGLRTGRQRALGLPLITAAMAGAGLWSARWFLDTAGALSPTAARELSLWVATLAWPVWMVLPVLFFPLDEPLDPGRLFHLPIPRRTLLVGLGLAGLVTPPILVPIAVLGADLWVFSTSPLAWVAGAVLLGIFSVGGQVFSAFASWVFRSRRGRDLAVLMVVGIGLAGFSAGELIRRRIATAGLEETLLAHPLTGFARLSPPGAAQDVVVRMGMGDPVGAVVSLGAATAWLVGLAAVWWWLIHRLATVPEAGPLGRRSRGDGLAGGRLPWSPAVAMARKELRSYLRDPRLRAVWTGAVVFPGIVVASLVLGVAGRDLIRSPWLVTVTPLVPLLVGLPVTLNQLGWERRSAEFLFSLPHHPRQVLAGKNLAATSALVTVTVVVALLAAAATGAWDRLWMVAPLTAAVIGCQLAVGGLISVLAPLRLPPPGTDVFAQATEEGCLAFLAQLIGFSLTSVLLMPVAAAAVLVELGALPAVWVAAAAPAWGGLILWIGFRGAAALLGRRAPEVVLAVRPA